MHETVQSSFLFISFSLFRAQEVIDAVDRLSLELEGLSGRLEAVLTESYLPRMNDPGSATASEGAAVEPASS